MALAWQVFAAHADGPNEGEASHFATSLADRLKRGVEDESEWGLDWKEGAEVQSTILQARGVDLDETAQQSIAALATIWSTDSTCAAHAARLLDGLSRHGNEAATNVITDWISRLFEDLPYVCLDWLAKNFTSAIADQQRGQLNSRLQKLVNTESISEEEAERYIRIMRSFSPEALCEEPLQSHLSNLCTRIEERRANPSNYLQRIFPTIPHVIEQCPNAESGKMLQQLFVDATGNPKLIGWLHGCMAGHWLEADESRGPYNPQVLFDGAAQVGLSHPNSDSMEGILESLTSMVSDEIVKEDAMETVAELACTLWPVHPAVALQSLQQIDETPQPEDVATMSQGIDPNGADDVGRLSTVWSHIAARMTDEELSHTAMLILSEPMRGNEGHPDLCLNVWVDAPTGRQPALLRRLMSEAELNDDQRKRVWLQIEQRCEQLGRSFLEEVLLIGFKVPDCPEALRAMVDSQDEINKLFTTKDQKYDLGKTLLESFVSVASIEIQNRLVEWLKSLNAADVLKDLHNLRTPTDEELEVLKAAFPGSRHLRKIHADD